MTKRLLMTIKPFYMLAFESRTETCKWLRSKILALSAIIAAFKSLLHCNHCCIVISVALLSVLHCNHCNHCCIAIIVALQSLQHCNHCSIAIIVALQSLQHCNHCIAMSLRLEIHVFKLSGI